jgi:hypothetical protein
MGHPTLRGREIPAIEFGPALFETSPDLQTGFNLALRPTVHQVGDVHSAQAGRKVPPRRRGVRLLQGFI